jgi:hypothetical protein
MYDTPILDVSNATPGTTAVTATLSTPVGIITKVSMNIKITFTGGTAYGVYLSSLNNIDLAGSATVAPLTSIVYNNSGQVTVFTNISSQIRYRAMENAPIYITTLGYEMSL